MNCTIATAVNDNAVLESCLLASPGIRGRQLLRQTGFHSAGIAYNEALERADNDVVLFAHQDVYLPDGWFARVAQELDKLEGIPWGVLGVYGVTAEGSGRGWIYSTGLQQVVGGRFDSPEKIRTLDEVILLIRKSSGIRFDEQLPGFHWYGTDLCLQAEQLGLPCLVVPCFAIHNSNGVRGLPRAFWRAWYFLRAKWKAVLPVHAPCATISRSFLPMAGEVMRQWWQFQVRRAQPGRRVSNPAELHESLERGKMRVPELAKTS